jgi:histidinol-phosphatase (PHP family)
MSQSDSTTPWMASLHGGHSGAFCDHAEDSLEALVQAAVSRRMETYGLTEHAPRFEAEQLFDEEIAMGWDVPHLARLCAAFVAEARRLQEAYADRINLLVGIETEVVPVERYVPLMSSLREEHGLDYIVGSVHWVDGIIIDYTQERFDQAVAHCGGLEEMVLRYYKTAAEMVVGLHPEVVGHLDLPRRYGGNDPALETHAVRAGAGEVLTLMKEQDAILDINTAACRKGLGTPYPAPWLLEMARDIGVTCCFGDDAHRANEVGDGIPEARDYLLAHGVDSVTVLTRDDTGLGRREVSLV